MTVMNEKLPIDMLLRTMNTDEHVLSIVLQQEAVTVGNLNLISVFQKEYFVDNASLHS